MLSKVILLDFTCRVAESQGQGWYCWNYLIEEWPVIKDCHLASQISSINGDSSQPSVYFLCLTWSPVSDSSHLGVPRWLTSDAIANTSTLKGGRGCLMSPPCLESQGCRLIPLCYSPLLFFCLVLLICLIFFCLWDHSSEILPETSSVFFVRR